MMPLPSLDLGRTALLLSFDGILADIAPQPEAVHAPAPLHGTLAALHAISGGALAIISGCAMRDIESRLSPPGLVIVGVHGAERHYADGDLVRPNADADALVQLERELRAELTQLSTQFFGVMLESKGIVFVLYYRHAPEAEDVVLTLADRSARSYIDHMRPQTGRMVVELKPHGASKGNVTHTLMAEPPFMGRIVLFASDDLIDESMFGAVNVLGDWSIKVGAGPNQARWRVSDAVALRAWPATLTTPSEQGAI